MARNRGKVLSLFRQILRSVNSPDLPLTPAARLAKRAEARAIYGGFRGAVLNFTIPICLPVVHCT
ncbi:hypothetical protein ACS0TY_012674 [Phlomoides rotata]